MLISVVICTYGRAVALRNLLVSLDQQTHRDFHVLVIDGNGHPSPARATIEDFLAFPGPHARIEIIESPKGLTRQRNAGLRHANGDLICFLDDDVTLEPDMLARIDVLLARPDMQDVGGITGYDVLNYPTPVTLRWRLRRRLGVIPSLVPGDADRLGRAVPISFLPPWSGFKQVGWLAGFCMIYRRSAIGALEFDEMLPTYGGEDRDFSMRVGRNSHLLIWGDLRIEHHGSAQGRESDTQRIFQSSYGVGRRFAKYARWSRDCPTIITTFLGDLLIDLLACVTRPCAANVATTFVRVRGFFSGLCSNTCSANPTAASDVRSVSTTR